MVDYLVVGMGLAGISFCEVLQKNKKSFIAISDTSQISSVVAGGLYNPVILKRFTLAWNAKEQMERAIPFYRDIELKLNHKLLHKVPVLRRFTSIEEQNIWFEAADKPNLKPFLSPDLKFNINNQIDAPYGYGEVLGTGRLDTAVLVKTYAANLLSKKLLLSERFDFEELRIFDSHVEYKSINAKQIVFATGFGLKENPYFNYLPLNGTKGELLTIKAPLLQETNVIKSSVFIIPKEGDLYRVGATYNREDKTNMPSDAAKEELQKKLNTFLKCPYEVVDHVAGIRPTVKDRKPLIGRHPQHPRLYSLNGFGSRGVMLAPTAAQQLYDLVETNSPLEKEIDISRFANKS
ncbi:NAD(P)/FAD-dependent oxidoreductase [Arenibacter certesii]|uniref:FAD-dependent oxidoreductase n=1 Tax=Arenibacter certesii TaxID=228955 RepID=A0A918IVX0_9FLAO|nr:FAD-dependent oxidoreductase [Arenibacter certesii]GGW34486.1 FAD-dependent oxidoreductase [Arenibacter certesii]